MLGSQHQARSGALQSTYGRLGAVHGGGHVRTCRISTKPPACAGSTRHMTKLSACAGSITHMRKASTCAGSTSVGAVHDACTGSSFQVGSAWCRHIISCCCHCCRLKCWDCCICIVPFASHHDQCMLTHSLSAWHATAGGVSLVGTSYCEADLANKTHCGTYVAHTVALFNCLPGYSANCVLRATYS